MGVLNLTAEMYMEQVYTMKPGDKPWFICMIDDRPSSPIFPTVTFLMKSLYFLQRDFPEKAVYAFVDGRSELILEAFDYDRRPQCVFVKDGKPYYAEWDALGVNTI